MTQNNEHGHEVPKMPSMKHLPWSQEEARQQKWLTETEVEQIFKDKQLIITEKMDGANACLTSDKVYARSHSAEPHREEWDYLKKQHREELMHKIPKRYAVFGEYLYAKHSIKYEKLPAYFMVFGVYDRETKIWKNWEFVEKIAELIDRPTVDMFGRQKYEDIDFPIKPTFYSNEVEGYVVRNTQDFHIDNLTENMAKCVRKNHVQTEELHWRKGGETETNDLAT